MRLNSLSLRTGIVVIGILATADVKPAMAQITYGTWVNTGECRAPRTTSGVGSAQLPRTPGAAPTAQCRWSREVKSCPKLSDKLIHPIQCSTKKQTKWSIGRPN